MDLLLPGEDESNGLFCVIDLKDERQADLGGVVNVDDEGEEPPLFGDQQPPLYWGSSGVADGLALKSCFSHECAEELLVFHARRRLGAEEEDCEEELFSGDSNNGDQQQQRECCSFIRDWATFADEERRVVARGATSKVYRIFHSSSGQWLAMKERRLDDFRAQIEARRELRAVRTIRENIRASSSCASSHTGCLHAVQHRRHTPHFLLPIATVYDPERASLLSFYPLLPTTLAQFVSTLKKKSYSNTCHGSRRGQACFYQKVESFAARVVAKGLLSALAFLHGECGLVHGDITANNILLLDTAADKSEEIAAETQGDLKTQQAPFPLPFDRLRIIDFGSSSRTADSNRSLPQPQEARGGGGSLSIRYASPSRCFRKAAAPSECDDAWAVGIILIELLLLGRHPYIAMPSDESTDNTSGEKEKEKHAEAEHKQAHDEKEHNNNNNISTTGAPADPFLLAYSFFGVWGQQTSSGDAISSMEDSEDSRHPVRDKDQHDNKSADQHEKDLTPLGHFLDDPLGFAINEGCQIGDQHEMGRYSPEAHAFLRECLHLGLGPQNGRCGNHGDLSENGAVARKLLGHPWISHHQ